MAARRKASAKGRAKTARSRKTAPAAKTGGKRKAASRRKAAARRSVRPDPGWVTALLATLEAHDPDPRCALDHANPYELVAATILSAQCTDKRVNMVTPALFARYPTPADLAAAEQEDVEELVRTTGFFRNKARNLIGMARTLVDDFGGQVPATMEALLTLPGVARKTANVVLGVCFDRAEGVVVDTHVLRIGRRLGLTGHEDPVKVERDLMAVLPPETWIGFSHRIIRLGRGVCDARKPRCDECHVRDLCPRVGVADGAGA